ncbi:hypothetical protein UFOVP204_171 [uncultured Caudovirales phage]|uniref:Uncharacterized protein n=1 Tax=uncultured Caudovirales phage TaxID=2100421 RepID=A0A6J7WJN2_9CAUD|nr:hypothetical protein UFOVP204_171 [uncultured Caudovirales phage]
MARLFLTNIDLNQNELQNAVIQNLSTAPSSGNTEGRIYYDSTRKTLRVWRNDALQGAKWYDLSVGGASASTVTLTGDVTGTANVDPTTGIITVNTHFNVSGTANQIAVNDIDNTTTISLTDDINVASGITIGESTKDGYINFVNATGTQYGTIDPDGGNLRITGNDGDILLLPDSNVVSIGSGFGELHLQKTEYWRGGTQQGIIAAQSDSSLRLTAAFGQLQLESNSGDVRINPSTEQTWFNNNLVIDGANGQISTDGTSITLNPDSGVVTTLGAELHTSKVELWQNGDNGGTNRGAVIAHPSDGSLTVAATGWLHLESHDGSINLDSQNGYTNFNGNISINSEGEIYASQGDLILTADSGNVVINDNLITDTILSKNGTNDTLNIVADEIILQSPDVKVGGGGTNGKFQVLDSNGTNAFVIDGSNKEAQFGGNLTVDGDLNVNGTLNAVNRTEINIEDNTIRLNTGFTGAPTADAGIIVERGTANDTAIIWSESNKDWTLTNDGSNYYAIARKFVSVVGDASNVSFDVVHNMNTRDLTVQVRENNADYNLVETDVAFKDVNTVTISFTVAPDANAYKVIIVG